MFPIQRHNAECRRPEEDDGDLGADHDDVHGDEVVVLVDADEYVEFVVETSVVVLVEDLEPDEHVEYD